MIKLFVLSLVLSLLPLVSFLVIYSFSYKYNRLRLLKDNYAIAYLDWIFVPFNFLIPLNIVFSWTRFIPAIILTIIGSIILNFKWKKMKQIPSETKYLINKNGFSPEGYTHLIFMSLQAAIISTVIISKAISSYYIILLALLLMYLIAYLIIIMLVRKVRVRSKVERPLLFLGIFLLIIRIIILYTLHY